jgi:putative flippase GtrA
MRISDSNVVSRPRPSYRQFLKYLAVGGLSNGLAYGIYVAMNWLGVGPLISMTAVYVVASGMSFTANKVWTFKSDAHLGNSLAKYIAVQIIGYITNLVLLTVLHYGFGMPHYLAQLVGITIVAIELFVLSRYYVFT